MRALMVLLASLWCGVASAACPDPYTGAELATDLSVLGTALRDQDAARFGDAAGRMESGLACTDQAVPRQALASAYRYVGIAAYRRGDEAGAKRWLRTALELEATYNFDVDEMDFSDPLRAVYEGERAAAGATPTALAGQALKTQEGTQWLLDGRPLTSPAATLDRPHLLQQVSVADNKVLGAWVIDGNSFPSDALRSTVVVAATPTKEKKSKAKTAPEPKPAAPAAEPDAYQVVKLERIRPPMKTPLMVLGGVGVLGGGAIYGLSWLAHQEFEAATTTEALLSAQKKTNLLVVASGSVLVLGLGVGYVGVTLDTGPGWLVGARF